jgi:hypothetical protein
LATFGAVCPPAREPFPWNGWNPAQVRSAADHPLCLILDPPLPAAPGPIVILSGLEARVVLGERVS